MRDASALHAKLIFSTRSTFIATRAPATPRSRKALAGDLLPRVHGLPKILDAVRLAAECIAEAP